jgi:hypothetical protein
LVVLCCEKPRLKIILWKNFRKISLRDEEPHLRASNVLTLLMRFVQTQD